MVLILVMFEECTGAGILRCLLRNPVEVWKMFTHSTQQEAEYPPDVLQYKHTPKQKGVEIQN